MQSFLLLTLLVHGSWSVSTSDHLASCLPNGIKLETVVSTQPVNPMAGGVRKTVTIADTLKKLKARCRRGKLVDGKEREIRFFSLIGCWGNPPEDYQELLRKQGEELRRIKKRYTVVELPCAQGDPRLISQKVP